MLMPIACFLTVSGCMLATNGTRPSKRRQGVFFVVVGLLFALGDATKGGAL